MTAGANQITKKERDCLLAIYRESSGSKFPPRLTDVAKAMGIRPPTAEDLLRRLEAKGLVARSRGLVVLSEEGGRLAEGLLSIHRALEVFFAGCGLSADEACELVGKFDYIVGPALAPRVLEALGNPTTCPHGYDIPGR